MEALGLMEHYVGDEAQQKRGLLSLQRPMEHGVVSDWEAMERVWQAAFGQLRVSAADRPVLMTEPVLNPMANRENMTQVGVAAQLLLQRDNRNRARGSHRRTVGHWH